ncbi:hypothetical protein LXL04_004355 [Taraxacum kok-saghyz]
MHNFGISSRNKSEDRGVDSADLISFLLELSFHVTGDRRVSVNVLLLVCTVWSHVHVKNVSTNQYMKTPSFKLASRLNPATLLLLPPKLLKPPIPLKSYKKKEIKKVKEVWILKKDPETLNERMVLWTKQKRQIKDTMNLVIKKRKEYEEKIKENGEAPVMFRPHLIYLIVLCNAFIWDYHEDEVLRSEEEERAKNLKLVDSVYYHPQWNPTGAPPPGKPSMYKSSIRPIVPLEEGFEVCLVLF